MAAVFISKDLHIPLVFLVHLFLPPWALLALVFPVVFGRVWFFVLFSFVGTFLAARLLCHEQYDTIRHDRRSRRKAQREGETEIELVEEEDLQINNHGIAILSDVFRLPDDNPSKRHQRSKSSKRREPPANTRSPPSEASARAEK